MALRSTKYSEFLCDGANFSARFHVIPYFYQFSLEKFNQFFFFFLSVRGKAINPEQHSLLNVAQYIEKCWPI